MSNNLKRHARADRVKWAIAFLLIILLIAGVTLALVKLFYKPPCEHEYQDGKCQICGAAEPTEEERQENISVAYNFAKLDNETLGVFASSVSAISVNDNGIMTADERASADVTFTNNYASNGTFTFSTSEAYKWSVSFGNYSNTLTGVCNTDYQTPTDPNGSFAQSSFTVNANTLLQQNKIEYNKQYTVNYTYQTMLWIDMGFMAESGYVLQDMTSGTCGTFMIEKVSDLPPTPSQTGYTFTGWYTDQACTQKYTDNKVVGDITLYAGFKANTYTVKFNANGGSGTMSNQTLTYDKAANLTANNFTRAKHAFKGWATSAKGAVVSTNSQSVKNLATAQGATINLYAVWEVSQYDVTFVADGKTVHTAVVDKNKAATLPTNPTKEGYTFVGWFLPDGTQYTNQAITANTTLTARFAIIRCTITFIVNGEVYRYYECDYGTNLSELLAQQVDPTQYSVEGEYSPNF